MPTTFGIHVVYGLVPRDRSCKKQKLEEEPAVGNANFVVTYLFRGSVAFHSLKWHWEQNIQSRLPLT